MASIAIENVFFALWHRDGILLSPDFSLKYYNGRRKRKAC
jgi:hypothetical protein